MRAMIYRRYGGPEVLELTELPDPVPGKGQLLLRVEASSINPIDWKRASGHLRLLLPVWFPGVPGYDVAGTVAALGSGVTGFSIGEKVHARIKESRGGASADLACVGVDVVARLPEGMSMADAAALPLAGMTALQGLRDKGGLQLAQSSARVLVLGASGGVGHFAVQLARAAGAFVIGVCSAKNAALVRSLGANEVLDYAQRDAYGGLAPVDLVFDAVHGNAGPWLKHLTRGGRYVSTLPTPALMLRELLNPLTPKKVAPVMLHANAADLAVLDGLWAAGKLRVVIDSTHPLEALAEAWKRSLSGRAAGKIIVTNG
jgi:NADPH:quinone reductase-like Zn-dependent oxidoreductase